MLANLIGGWLATRYGIQRMLTVGLVTQIAGFTLLSMLDPGWTAAASVAWVVVAQGICGVAKDLTKTASKSAIKITKAQARRIGFSNAHLLFHDTPNTAEQGRNTVPDALEPRSGF